MRRLKLWYLWYLSSTPTFPIFCGCSRYSTKSTKYSTKSCLRVYFSSTGWLNWLLIEKHIIYFFLKEHTVKLCILFMKIIHWTRNFVNTAWVSKDLKEISNSFTSGFTTIFNEKRFCYLQHCVKSVSIRSFSGPHFSEFGLNKEIYRVKCGK